MVIFILLKIKHKNIVLFMKERFEDSDIVSYVAKANIKNGFVQTAIAYRNASNNDSYAPNNVDGIVIEFTTGSLDFVPSEYVLREIIVNNK